MADLPVSSETPEASGSVPQAVDMAGNAYAAACEQARQIAMTHREQTAEQEGNKVE